ncbi:MAG: RNA methyltransferase, partial [Thermomicrobiaceae bacterium]|nr:RNA methyltransferase [Thermomicrobiaceae bacterium]
MKYARSLHRSKVRHEERAFLVEGRRLLADALDAGAAPTLVFFVPGQHGEIDRLAHRASERGARVIPTDPEIL